MEDDALNEMGDPTTGDDGLNVKTGTGGAGVTGGAGLTIIDTSALVDNAPSEAVSRST